jgi:ligand-binding SRPBCC domain-containing protein
LRLFGVPFHWRTVITAWQPSILFADDQARGPYQLWHHEHRFNAIDSGTEIVDRVEYRVSGGPIEPIIHTIFVGPQVKKIFDYRRQVILEVFGQRP